MPNAHGTGEKVAVYIRMSSKRQEDSPERQRSTIGPHVDRKGYQLFEEYVDYAMTGDSDRPSFNRMVEDAIRGRFRYIVIDQWDRLTRQEFEDFIADVQRPLKRAGVRIDSVTDGLLDWDTLGGMMVAMISQLKASAEPKTIARRVLTHQRAQVAKGRPHARRAPFGYMWEYVEVVVGERTVKVRDRLIPHPVNAPIFQEICRLIAEENYTGEMVSDWLFLRGIPRPGAKGKLDRWYPSAITAMLRKRVYLGFEILGQTTQAKRVATRNGEVVVLNEPRTKKLTGAGRTRKTVTKEKQPESEWVISAVKHQPLISQQLYERVGAVLDSHLKARGRGKNRSYPLCGLLKCSICERNLTVCRGGKMKQVVYYVCGNSPHPNILNPCPFKSVREEVIFPAICEQVGGFFLNKEKLKQLMTAACDLAATPEQEAGSVAIKGRLKKLRDEIAKITRNMSLLETPEEMREARQLRADKEDEAKSIEESLSPAVRDERIARLKAGLAELAECETEFTALLNSGDRNRATLLLERFVKCVVIRWSDERAKVGRPGRHGFPPVGGIVVLQPDFYDMLEGVFGTSETVGAFLLTSNKTPWFIEKVWL
jgi:site-specific DNA recombinase